MKTYQGLVLSILIHLCLLWLFFWTKEHIKTPPVKQEHKTKLNLKYFNAPKPKPKPQNKKQADKIVTPKDEPIKNIAKIETEEKEMEALVKEMFQTQRELEMEKTFFTTRQEELNVTDFKLVRKKVKRRKVSFSKTSSQKVVYSKKRSKKSLAKKLLADLRNITNFDNIISSYGAYGGEFEHFTKTQKKFIQKNLNRIQSITQRTLTRRGYPDVSVRTLQQGTNIVSFYLYPNGDISNLRLNKHLGYELLDKNTLKTIRIAYKNYPRPKQKTKIKFYVEYTLY